MNNRRKLVIALGAGALVAPLGSFAQQQGKVWRIGFVTYSGRPESLDSHFYGAFVQGMRDLGYIEGKNLAIEWRFADSKAERLPGFVAELVKMNVDLIVTGSTPVASVAQKATKTVPIVMASSSDPVSDGLIDSLAHPGSNITGLTSNAPDIIPKQVEMLRSIVPTLSHAVVLLNPDHPTNIETLKMAEAAAKQIGITLSPMRARSSNELEQVFFQASERKIGGLVLSRDGLFNQQVRQIAELAKKLRLPTIAGFREYADAGGLLCYGPNLKKQFRLAATYVDKIFKGAKPANLPVEQPTQFELIINGKTAKTLGLKIPQSLLIMAEKVIE